MCGCVHGFEVEPMCERADIVAMARFGDSPVRNTDWVLRMLIAHRTYSPLMMDALRTARTMDEGIAALWRLDGTPDRGKVFGEPAHLQLSAIIRCCGCLRLNP